MYNALNDLLNALPGMAVVLICVIVWSVGGWILSKFDNDEEDK